MSDATLSLMSAWNFAVADFLLLFSPDLACAWELFDYRFSGTLAVPPIREGQPSLGTGGRRGFAINMRGYLSTFYMTSVVIDHATIFPENQSLTRHWSFSHEPQTSPTLLASLWGSEALRTGGIGSLVGGGFAGAGHLDLYALVSWKPMNQKVDKCGARAKTRYGERRSVWKIIHFSAVEGSTCSLCSLVGRDCLACVPQLGSTHPPSRTTWVCAKTQGQQGLTRQHNLLGDCRGWLWSSHTP